MNSVFETLTVRAAGPVLLVEIAAPPMNLLGPELVRDLVSLIQRAEADDAVQVLVFKSADPNYFRRPSSPVRRRSPSCFAI
jgi:enoyl-CoA hydratase/carnithine racemase